MEFKVWVDGIQRVVCGVTEETTCQDIIFALAHATGKIGRFSLQERWRENERLLVPSENPLKTLHKWGEYASEVQYVLRHSDKNCNEPSQTVLSQNHKFPRNGGDNATVAGLPTANLRKSLSFSGAALGFPRKQELSKKLLEPLAEADSTQHVREGSADRTCNSLNRQHFKRETVSASPEQSKRSISKSHQSDPRRQSLSDNSLPASNAKLNGLHHRYSHSTTSGFEMPRSESPPVQYAHSSLGRRSQRGSHTNEESPSITASIRPRQKHEQFTLIHPIRSPGSGTSSPTNSLDRKVAKSLPLPGYGSAERNPKKSLRLKSSSPTTDLEQTSAIDERSDIELPNLPDVVAKGGYDKKEFEQQILQQGTYSDIQKLVELQQERLKLQSSQMRIIDSEINFWEEKEGEASQQFKQISDKIKKVQEQDKSHEKEKEGLLKYAEKLKREESRTNDILSSRQLLEKKLADCIENVEGCKVEMKAVTEKMKREVEGNEKRAAELKKREVDSLKASESEMNKKMEEYKASEMLIDSVELDVKSIEQQLTEKERLLLKLETELRQLNLDSFISPTDEQTTSDEKKSPTSLPARPGSARKLANPQKLIEAVATPKNPHGMWV